MAYVPQFIPTNTQVLQGTLDQYQQASDKNTGVLNQANDLYSALPTTNPYDTTMKNELMDKFQKEVIAGLDKKYNYDRSNQQYAKELASEISKLRSNPLWTLVKERDQVDKVRQQLMAQRGSDYHENTNPDKITDVSQLKDWKPMDLKDLERGVAMAGQAKVKTMQPTTKWRNTGKGYWELAETQGYTSREEAMNYLDNNKEGQDLIDQTAMSLGFDPSDPKIRDRAYSAALSQLVGDTKYSYPIDRDYVDAEAAARARATKQREPLPPLPQIGTQTPEVKPYEVGKLSDVPELTSNIKKLEEELRVNPSDATQAELDRLQVQRGKINAIVKNIEGLPANTKIINSLHTAINNKLGENAIFIAGDKSSDIYDILRDSFINTSVMGRSPLNPFSGKTKSDITAEIVDALKIYVDPNGKVNPKDVIVMAKEIVKIGEDWYKGKNNFGVGYATTIEKQINKKLSDGEQNVYEEYALPLNMPENDKKALKTYLVSSLHIGTPVESEYREGGKSGILWKKGKADELKVKLADANTSVGFLFDNQENARIQLRNPGDAKTEATTVTYKLDPAIVGYDMLAELVGITGDTRFLDSIYSQFDVEPNKEYSFKDKNGYLSRTLGKFFKDNNNKPDIDMFRDFRIAERSDGYNIQYEVYVGDDDTEPTVYPNKSELLQALAAARKDYKTNRR